MPSITVQITGTPPENMMARIPQAIDAAMDAMAAKFMEIAVGNFGLTGAHRPSDWPPLSPNYQRRIKYFGPPLLILSGDLLANIKLLEKTKNSFTVGNLVHYASTQQRGGGPVPARPFFPVIESGEQFQLTPYAQQEMEGAALAAMQNVFG